MRILKLTSLLLAINFSAQLAAAPPPLPIDFSDLSLEQLLPLAAESLQTQSCYQQLPAARRQQLLQKYQYFNTQLQQLCKQGQREQAHKFDIEVRQRAKREPEYLQLRQCMQRAPNTLKVIDQMLAKAERQHICERENKFKLIN